MEKIFAIRKEENAREIRTRDRERQERNGLLYGYKAIRINERGDLETLLELRESRSAGGAWYACAWLSINGKWKNASASTPSNNTSGGYNKRGAVTVEALTRLGYSFPSSRKEYATSEDAAELMRAICEAENCGKVYIVEMHY